MRILATILLAAVCSTASAQPIQTNGKFTPQGTAITLHSVANSTFSSVQPGTITLYSYTLPSGTLKKEGDTLFITCISSQTGASTNRNNAIYFGGALLTPSFVSSGSTDWKTTAEIAYESGTRIKTFSERTRSGTWTTATSLVGDPTIDNLIECTGIGVGTAGDLSGILFRVEYRPAP